jgi:hypothetical protein
MLLHTVDACIAACAQVWVGVVPVGPSGVSLTSAYNSREDPKYREDLGNAIVNFARLVPDGLLVFFSSYFALQGCVDFWKSARAGAARPWGSTGLT